MKKKKILDLVDAAVVAMMQTHVENDFHYKRIAVVCENEACEKAFDASDDPHHPHQCPYCAYQTLLEPVKLIT